MLRASTSTRTRSFASRARGSNQRWNIWRRRWLSSKELRWKFHQHFMSNFFCTKVLRAAFFVLEEWLDTFLGTWKLVQKLLLKCWWNWLQVLRILKICRPEILITYPLDISTCILSRKLDWKISFSDNPSSKTLVRIFPESENQVL